MRRGVLFSIVVALTVSCTANILVVDFNGSGDYLTIQNAIDAAQNGDTVLVRDGIYVGDGNREIDFGGKSIIVKSHVGPEVTIIDCQNNARGFYFHSNEDESSVLEGFTIINGHAYDGAGVYCDNASPSVRDCIFIDGVAENWGGGITCFNASPIISSCTFTGNSAFEGGAITTRGDWGYSCSPRIKNCHIFNNMALGSGGGINSDCLSTPIISNCLINGNFAGTYGGGGISIFQSNPTISGCTIVDNSTESDGSGILQWYEFEGGSTIKNCILWGNSFGFNPDPFHGPSGPQISVGSEMTISFCDIEGMWIDALPGANLHFGEGLIDEYPLFVDMESWDYRLLQYSLCVDAGDPSYFPESSETDIDGLPRRMGFAVDIGAYEVPGSIIDPGIIALSEDEVGLYIGGMPELYIEGSGIYVNSWHYDALRIIGDAFGRGESLLSEINVVGDYYISNRVLDNLQTANNGEPTIIRTGVRPISDPLAEIPELPLMPISPTAFVGEISVGNHILEPGYYPNGIEINGGNVTLLPGIYQLGRNALDRGLSIIGYTNVFAQNVMLHLLDSSLLVDCFGEFRLRPPSDGPYQGISIFQSRSNWNMSDIFGHGGLDLAGVFYFPENHLSLRAFEGENMIGSQIIANTIEIEGEGVIRITVPYPTDTPLLHISATGFDFDADEARQNPAPQTLLISNIGSETLNWQIIEDCPWLEVSPVIGESTGELDEVTLSVNAEGLVQGQYHYTLMVEADGAFGSPQAVDIHLTVHGPRIDLSASKIEFYLTDGNVTPESHTFTITNGAGGTLNWNLNYDCDWFMVDPVSGTSITEPNELTIQPGDLSGFTVPGHYRCEMVVTGENASNSPHIIEVMLHVEGELRVPEHYPTIQTAIDASIDGDVVVVSQGIYRGNGNRNLDFRGRAITVRSINPDDPDVVAATVIDCEGTAAEPHRAFTFISEEDNNSVVAGLTIINGYGPYETLGSRTFSAGGAIYCSHSSPKISKCNIENNYAETGGAIYGWYSDILITDCDISKNSSNEGIVYMLTNNPVISHCRIFENSATGIRFLNCGYPVINNCEIFGNVSKMQHGGGIYIRGAFNGSLIENCLIYDNTASSGGGILYDRSYAIPIVKNSTICNNRPYGIRNYAFGAGPKVRNCIVWGNRNIQLYEYFVQVSYSDIQGGYSGEGNINANPLFCDPNSYDYHLLPTSPCINVGDPMYNYVGQIDIDGEPRVMNGRVDMGADEIAPNIAPVANTVADITVYAWVDGLAEARLDGTGSYDPDGDALTYSWYNDANELVAVGAEPNVVFGVGEHVIRLVVNDGIEDSEPDECLVTVIPIQLEVVQKERVGRSTFAYRLAAVVENTHAYEMLDVQMRLVDADEAERSVEDDLIVIGAITPGEIMTTQDTFAMTVDRSVPILASRLTLEVTYSAQGQQAAANMSMPLSILEPVPGDISGDGKVNFRDLAILTEQWQQAPSEPSADIAPPADNYVGLEDLLYLAEHWLQGAAD